MSCQLNLYAGVAKRDITTGTLSPERIRDPLYVRCLVVDDGRAAFVIMALDAVGIGWISDIPNDFLSRLRSAIERRFDIPAAHVLVSATHTHPSGEILHCPPEELLARCLEAVTEARRKRTLATASAARGKEDRFSMNRTLRLKDGTHWSARHANPCPPDSGIAELGPLDSSIGILRLDRVEDGKTLAVLFNFACHPLWADGRNRISANYPGIACDLIEESLPGATALFLQGAGGDVIDRGFKNFEADREQYIVNMGTQLGLSTLRALRDAQAQPYSSAPLAFATRTVRLPRRRDIQGKLDELEQKALQLRAQLRGCPLNFRSFLPLYLKYQLNGDFPLDYAGQYLADAAAGRTAYTEMDEVNRTNLDKYLANIQIMEQLTRLEDRKATFQFHQKLNGDLNDVGAEINVLRIGEFVLVTSPTEMLTQVGLNIKAASPYRNTFIGAYCNGYLHYGSPEDYYDKDGYEVTECMLAPGWQAIHETAVTDLLQELAL